MTQSTDNTGDKPVAVNYERDEGLHTRILRTMIVASILAVLGSMFLGPWQFTSGLIIGGVLALLNHRWLQTSTSAAFGVLLNGEKPRITIGKYILRYAVVSLVAFAASQLGIASLVAIIAGLCTFVVALFVEAVREFYFAIIRREEIG
ncbi:MAG TPA: ATP synthase subunit I [Pyrinomonadaceae bacterium]|nr:ATP synthase subunit I [Pyrinomonadaceae bacterium]